MSAAMHQFESMESRILRITRQNEEIKRRHLEVERDRLAAERCNAAVKTSKISTKLEDMMPAERKAFLGLDRYDVRDSQFHGRGHDPRVIESRNEPRNTDWDRMDYHSMENYDGNSRRNHIKVRPSQVVRNIAQPFVRVMEAPSVISPLRPKPTSTDQLASIETSSDCFMFSDIAALDLSLPVDPELPAPRCEKGASLLQPSGDQLNASKESYAGYSSVTPSINNVTAHISTSTPSPPKDINRNIVDSSIQNPVKAPSVSTQTYCEPIDISPSMPNDVSLHYSVSPDQHVRTPYATEKFSISPREEVLYPATNVESTHFLKTIDFSKPPPNVLTVARNVPVTSENYASHPGLKERQREKSSLAASSAQTFEGSKNMCNYPTVNQVAQALASLSPPSNDGCEHISQLTRDESVNYQQTWPTFHDVDSGQFNNQPTQPTDYGLPEFANTAASPTEKPRYRPILGRGASEKGWMEVMKILAQTQQPVEVPFASQESYGLAENYRQAPMSACPISEVSFVKKKSAIQERMEAARNDTTQRFARKNIGLEGGITEGLFNGVSFQISPPQTTEQPRMSLAERMESKRNSNLPLGRSRQFEKTNTSTPVMFSCEDIREKEKLEKKIVETNSSSEWETEESDTQ